MGIDYAYTPNVWPSITTALFLFFLAVYSFLKRKLPGALPFAFACLFAVFSTISITMEYAAVNNETKIFWSKIEYSWLLPCVTAITCFILDYAWPGRWLTRRNLALLSIVPLLSVLLIFTNDFHHLSFVGFTSFEHVTPQYGPAGWVFLIYAYAITLLNLIVFIWLFRHSPQHRWPVAIMLIAQVIVRVLFLLNSPKNESWFFAIPEILFAFLAYAIVLFGFHIFDPVPLAHMMIISQMREGMLVLNPQERVVSLNPAAQAILAIPVQNAIGRSISNLIPWYTNTDGGSLADEDDQVEISLGNGSKARDYILFPTTLKDWRGLIVGRVLLLQDVTEQKQVQAKIMDSQRALAVLQEREQLARELHDNLGQVFAFVNTQGQAVRQLLCRGDILAADEYVARLVDVAHEADVDIRESILGLHETLSQQGLFSTLEQYLIKYEQHFGIHTNLKKPESIKEEDFDSLVEAQLLRVIQEALTNIRKHADAKNVEVKFERDDGWLRVTIKDDGNGFDPFTRNDGDEKHIGLRVMRERAEEVGGRLNLNSEVGQGTEVVVQVPVKGKMVTM